MHRLVKSANKSARRVHFGDDEVDEEADDDTIDLLRRTPTRGDQPSVSNLSPKKPSVVQFSERSRIFNPYRPPDLDATSPSYQSVYRRVKRRQVVGPYMHGPPCMRPRAKWTRGHGDMQKSQISPMIPCRTNEAIMTWSLMYTSHACEIHTIDFRLCVLHSRLGFGRVCNVQSVSNK